MNLAFYDEATIDPELFELLGGFAEVEQTRRDFFRIAGTGIIIALLLGERRCGPATAAGGGGWTT